MGSLSGFEIVLLEDSAELALQIRKILEADGALVTEARTARSGVAACVETYPHLVISDLSLIGHGGFQFLVEAKKLADIRRIPVLALGSPDDKQGILRAMRLGATD